MTDLLSFRLQSVSSLLTRGASLRYKREFGVTLWEWRALALARQGLSQKDLVRIAGIDKGQVSRVVSGMVERELIVRTPDENDARGARLSLTAAGVQLYEGLIKAAAERNTLLLATLTEAERSALETALAKLGNVARELIEREREFDNGD